MIPREKLHTAARSGVISPFSWFGALGEFHLVLVGCLGCALGNLISEERTPG